MKTTTARIRSRLFYQTGSYGTTGFLAQMRDYMLGVTLARLDINLTKPRFFDMVRGDVVEVGGYDAYFKDRYRGGRLMNLDRVAGPHVDIIANAECMPEVASGSLGGAACISVLEHTENPDAIVAELHRCLMRDGLLLLSVPWQFEEHMEPMDFHRFSQSRVEALLAGKFEILELHHANGYLGLAAHVLQQSLSARILLGWIFMLASRMGDRDHRRFSTQITVIARKLGA